MKEVINMKFFYRGYPFNNEFVEVSAEVLNGLLNDECAYSNTCVALVEVKGNEMYFEYFEGND